MSDLKGPTRRVRSAVAAGFYAGLTDASSSNQEFAFEAAVRMRDRFLQQEVWGRMGIDVRKALKLFDVPAEVKNEDPIPAAPCSPKIVPNCKKLGLLDAGDGCCASSSTCSASQLRTGSTPARNTLDMRARSPGTGLRRAPP